MRFPIKIGLPGSNRQLFQGMKNGLIRDVVAGTWWWRQRLRIGAGVTNFTPAAATSQVIIFSEQFPNNLLPERIIRKSVLLAVVLPLVGPSISAGTAIIGDDNDPNGMLESGSGNIFAAGVRQHLAAVEIAAGEQYENDLATTDEFQTTLASTGANLSVATQLDLIYMVEFTPASFVP